MLVVSELKEDSMKPSAVTQVLPLCIAAITGVEAQAGVVQIGVLTNTLVVTQYTSNSGGGVQTTPGTIWASGGFAPWSVVFATPYASMTATFSAWSSQSLDVSVVHYVAPATQSTFRVEGDISFQVDRDSLHSVGGNYTLYVVNPANGAQIYPGTLLRRGVPYILRFGQVTSGVGFSTSAAGTLRIENAPPVCAGDVTQNGAVDGTDLAAVLGSWGTAGLGEYVTDIDADGIVGGEDLAVVLSAWGACP